jgi:hypothetical protein
MAGRIVTCDLQMERETFQVSLSLSLLETIQVSLSLLAGIKSALCVRPLLHGRSKCWWAVSVITILVKHLQLTCLLPLGLSVMLLQANCD